MDEESISPIGLVIGGFATYELVDDPRVSDEGVGALARAAEHINFAWAMLGFFVRLPLLRQWLQLLADVSGGNERLIPRARPSRLHGPRKARQSVLTLGER